MKYLDVSVGVINARKISETRKLTVKSALDRLSMPRNLFQGVVQPYVVLTITRTSEGE
jgi:hypothetical protein